MTPEHLAGLHQRAFTNARPWSAAEFAALLSSPHCFLEGDSKGFALGRVIAGEAELLTLAVDPNFQRSGRGHALLQAYHKTAQERSGTTAFLEVAADNRPAISLYLSNGYTETGRRKSYYTRQTGPAVDALILSRDL
ncbi:GNAT family N-acetyltransferase [Cognatishimia sp. SS12]|uniref:GNAT family N-acetyltransferase n=1 Tax=Cognatishimia sp. SS12 TaxID=2979465 RepID=UPI00232CA60F|nr:GNAT family N-acetyltransferase [Cognatishimia sp. SS12]MDC0739025.1 GNAT family N-acetyltransferase [Cognatishimia sp. SS12]